MTRTIISILLSLSMLSNVAMAECDFSKGITPGPDKTFIYTEECHQKVGIMKKQIEDYKQVITLKDLAIQKADERTQLWMDTSFKLEDRIEKIDKLQKGNDWLYFTLGALTVIGTGMALANLTSRR